MEVDYKNEFEHKANYFEMSIVVRFICKSG